MRIVKEEQTKLGQVDIAEIEFDLRSRDEIPKLLMGLQYIYCNPEYREPIFKILEEMNPKGINANKGRPGMSYWKILVLGTLRLNCNWDYDKVKDIADNHITIRQMLGHGIEDESTKYPLQTIRDNVSLFTPEILNKINEIVVKAGHNLVKKKEEKIKAKCDSFVVETDVHYPTDINLLLDVMRKIIIFVFRLCELTGLSGWRQHLHIFKKVKKLYRRAQGCTNSYRRSKKKKERKEKEMKEAYKKYVSECAKIIKRVKETIESTPVFEMKIIAIIYEIKRYIPHGERQIEQIIRRVLDGEKIPHEEKVFSIFEEHTEWISKGKAGVPQELGLNVCVIEDQYKFILYHEVMEKITDVEIAVPIAKKTLEMYPNLSVISYDRGFYSPQNKIDLNKILDEVILPKKGRLLKEEREYENSEHFQEMRRKHSAVESGINALENHGLDRCADHGIIGFKRYIALAVLGRNLQNLGNIIQEKKKKLNKHEEEKRKRVA